MIADVRERVRRHLDGLLVGPVMVALARSEIAADLDRGPVDLLTLSAKRPSLAYVFDLLAAQGWVRLGKDSVELTPCGRYAVQIASAYGVTVSYLPLFMVLNTLLFGNPRIPRIDEVAVDAFLKGEIGFADISRVVAQTLDETSDRHPESIEEVLAVDAQAREVARQRLSHQLTR